MRKIKKPMMALAAGSMLLSTGGSVGANLCAVTTCRDVAVNHSSSNRNSSATPAWRSVTLRGNNSANSNGSARVRAQFRVDLPLGMWRWDNDVSRNLAPGANSGNVNATAFAAGNARRWRARIEPSARVTATARVTRRNP